MSGEFHIFVKITLMIYIFGHLPELSNHCLVYLYPHLKKNSE